MTLTRMVKGVVMTVVMTVVTSAVECEGWGVQLRCVAAAVLAEGAHGPPRRSLAPSQWSVAWTLVMRCVKLYLSSCHTEVG